MAMELKSFGISDIGQKREKNEDSFLASDRLMLYAVADGMGGHLGGDIASRLAVDTIEEVIGALEADPDTTLQDDIGIRVRKAEFQSYLRYAIGLASRRIFEKARSDESLRGMGTTSVVLLLRNNKAYIANVGDSRAYRIRGESVVQITKDHSLVGEQIRAGLLSEGDARVHRLKNVITRSVGFQEDVEVDIEIRALREGDIYLLCSDGLSNLVEGEEMRDVVVTNEPEDACRRLVDIANARGGDDNITVVIVRIDKLDEEGYVVPTDDSTVEL